VKVLYDGFPENRALPDGGLRFSVPKSSSLVDERTDITCFS
jgi:hypothetical protein